MKKCRRQANVAVFYIVYACAARREEERSMASIRGSTTFLSSTRTITNRTADRPRDARFHRARRITDSTTAVRAARTTECFVILSLRTRKARYLFLIYSSKAYNQKRSHCRGSFNLKQRFLRRRVGPRERSHRSRCFSSRHRTNRTDVDHI